jgi:hypothetical protein
MGAEAPYSAMASNRTPTDDRQALTKIAIAVFWIPFQITMSLIFATGGLFVLAMVALALSPFVGLFLLARWAVRLATGPRARMARSWPLRTPDGGPDPRLELTMDAVPYEIREEDVDEVLDAYEPVGGGDWPEERRQEARAHVMDNILDMDETVRSASEDPSDGQGAAGDRAGGIGDRPGERAPERRDMALAAIEDLLIRDGFLDLEADESRVFPVTGEPDTERNDA